MDRDNFLFKQSSRLYRQSESLTAFLFESFLGDKAPFQDTFDALDKLKATHLADESARKKAADLAWEHMLAVGGALDPRAVVPGLIEAIEQYYYGGGPEKDALPWLGTTLKVACAVVWKNRRSVTASVKAHGQIRRFVAAAGAWEQLQSLYEKGRAWPVGAADFKPEGTWLVERKDQIQRAQWNEFAQRRGMALRTLPHCSEVIWRSGGMFLAAVNAVLNGKCPAQISLFQGTVFEEIGLIPEFWLGLSVRLQIMAHASAFRGVGREEATRGVAVFESFPVHAGVFGRHAEKAEAIIHSAFWTPEWHAVRLRNRDWLSNMLVERPAVRIDGRTFAVGILHIGDSINCFVEHSVFRYFGYAGVPVSEEAFRRHLSQPFEEQAIAIFNERGWQADHVSDHGIWSGVSLNHQGGEPIPGEVDVLALHPDGHLAVLAECKVLSSPDTPGKLINVAKKLGPTDAESFHSKLDRKARWLQATETFRDVTIRKLLLVDAGAFLGADAPHQVLDIADLPELISQWQ